MMQPFVFLTIAFAQPCIFADDRPPLRVMHEYIWRTCPGVAFGLPADPTRAQIECLYDPTERFMWAVSSGAECDAAHAVYWSESRGCLE